MLLAQDFQKGHKGIPATQTSVLVPPGNCSQTAKKILLHWNSSCLSLVTSSVITMQRQKILLHFLQFINWGGLLGNFTCLVVAVSSGGLLWCASQGESTVCNPAHVLCGLPNLQERISRDERAEIGYSQFLTLDIPILFFHTNLDSCLAALVQHPGL